MNIDADLPVFAHKVNGFADVAKSALAEDIVFEEPHFFGHIHIELRNRKAFGRHLCGGIGVNRCFRNNYTAGMDAEMVRKSVEPLAVAENEFADVVGIIGQFAQVAE